MRACRIALAAFALVSCLGLAMSSADELAFGFEEDKDGDNVPDLWAPEKGNEKNVSIDKATKKSGEASIRLDDASEWEYVVARRMADVKPATAYRLKAWAKTDKTTGPTCIYISEYHAQGKGSGLLKLHVLIIEQPGDWKEFEKEFTTTDQTGRVSIELCPAGFAIMHTGTAWFDDVRVEKAK